MPRGDGTGPMGAGAATGRGAGYCAGFAVPGFVNGVSGGGFGGRGKGGGWRGGRGFRGTRWPGWARAGDDLGGVASATGPQRTSAPQSELQMLKQQADQAAELLQSIQQRIRELEGTVQP